MKPDSVKKDLIRWRGIWNLKNKEIREDELCKASSKESEPGRDGDDSSVASNDNKRHTSRKKGHYDKVKKIRRTVRKRKMRRTNTKSSGLTDPGIIVYIKDTEDEASSSDESDGDSFESEGNDRRPKKASC